MYNKNKSSLIHVTSFVVCRMPNPKWSSWDVHSYDLQDREINDSGEMCDFQHYVNALESWKSDADTGQVALIGVLG